LKFNHHRTNKKPTAMSMCGRVLQIIRFYGSLESGMALGYRPLMLR